MDKIAAKKLVKDTLEQPFDKVRFSKLVGNILGFKGAHFINSSNRIPRAFADAVRVLERLGKYKDNTGNRIDILVIHLKKETSLERARTKQRNFVARYLNGSDGGELRDAALVAFVAPGDANWRFSLVKLEYQLGDDGKVKQEATPARRHSFLVGVHESSHTAQSRLVDFLQHDAEPTLGELETAFSVEPVTEGFFAKYRELFLRIKEALDGIIEENSAVADHFKLKGIDPRSFAEKLLGQIVFLYFLQKKGWFGVEDGKEWGTGSKNFLRELFKRKHCPYQNFFNDILEPLFYKALRHDRGAKGDYFSEFNCKIPFLNGGLFDPMNDYDWENVKAHLPDNLFSNTTRTKDGAGTGVLDVFDRYNFTVNEDEPLEKEVAVDPEMLGKVFESLLEDKQSTGTYYTPREIVHYMCKESLVNYLSVKLGGTVDRKDIEALIHYGKSESKCASIIDGGLASIRVCDPAVGSGAFPVGMMNEIAHARNALTNHIGKNRERTYYHFKRHAIENCLYGVDIDAVAVDIAKLRLWLSLVVDEGDRKIIQPLPNLDYKIVRGNALLCKSTTKLSAFDELEEKKGELLNERNFTQRQWRKNEIEKIIDEIFDDHGDFDFAVYFSEVFHDNAGFDVVIANPPYAVLEGSGARGFVERIRAMTGEYAYSLGGKLNLYRLFIERGFQITRANGVQTYIVPSTILADKNTAGLRKMFSAKGDMKFFIEIPEKTKVFKKVTQAVAVFSVQKRQRDGNFFLTVNLQSKIDQPKNTVEISWGEIEKIAGADLAVPLIAHPAEKSLLSKLHSNKIALGAFAKIVQGDVNLTSQSKYITSKPASHLLVRGEHISRFHVDLSSANMDRRWIDFRKMKKELSERKILAISENFARPRIVCQNIVNMGMNFRIVPAFIPPKVLVGHSAEFLYSLTAEWDIKAIFGVLASRVINWRFKKTSTNNHVNIYELENLPFPRLARAGQRPLVNLVDKILAITSTGDYLTNPAKQSKVRALEAEIDKLVYQLYDLTPEEIAIIENR